MNIRYVAVVTATLLGGGVPIAGASDLVVSSAYDGAGTQGMYSDAGVTVRFESCASATGFRSIISKADGAAVTDFVKDGDVVSYRIAGVLFGGDLPDTQRKQVDATLTSAETRTAPKLYQEALLRMGFAEKSTAMLALAANFTGYEVSSRSSARPGPPPPRSSRWFRPATSAAVGS